MKCICEGTKWIIADDWPIGETLFVYPCVCIGGPLGLIRACESHGKDYGTIRTWNAWKNVPPGVFKQRGWELVSQARERERKKREKENEILF